MISEHTLIAMADGSMRPIKMVRVVNQTATRHGGALVFDTWKSVEGSFIRLSVQGYKLEVSKDCPILAADGMWRRAETLKEGDQILTTKGTTELLKCEAVDDMILAYHLSFRENEPVTMIAGKIFYVGDMEMQRGRLNSEV